jgi:hypothetical protein
MRAACMVTFVGAILYNSGSMVVLLDGRRRPILWTMK